MQGGAELREGCCAWQEEHVSLEERSACRLSALPAAVPGGLGRRGPNQSVDRKKMRLPSRPHAHGLLVFFPLEQNKSLLFFPGLGEGLSRFL